MENGVEAQINYLLNNNLTTRISKNKTNIHGKGRIYNQDKPPSKILTKVVGSLYNKQSPKESKPTRRIRKIKEAPPNSADVLFKFDVHKNLDTTKSKDSEKDFEASQKNEENAQTVELKFRVEIEIIERDPDTGEPIGDAKKQTIEKFIEAQTVYGGDVGLKLYIKYKIVQLFRRLEDSSVTIKQIL